MKPSNSEVKNTTIYDSFLKSKNNFQNNPSKNGGPQDNNLLKIIDSILEMHKKDIEQRNDMIMHTEKGLDAMRQELQKEKKSNEEKQKQINELITGNSQLSMKYKNIIFRQNIIDCPYIFRLEESQNKLNNSEKEKESLKEELKNLTGGSQKESKLYE